MMTVDRARPAPMVLRLRLAARREPAATASRLHTLLARPVAAQAGPEVVADLHALHAEVLLQCGNLPAALDAATIAAETAAMLEPRDWSRLATVLLIGADLYVWARDPRALLMCESACNAFTYLDQRDPGPAGLDLATVALALHAVAVFHTDPRHGYTLLHNLACDSSHEAPAFVMLTNGLAAMQADAQPNPGRPGHTSPSPLPGGLLHPRLDTEAAGYLASRVHARPASDRAVS